MDYMILVNQSHPLPEGWEKSLQTVTVVNSVGDEVVVEKKTYDAYLLLKKSLKEKDGICLEPDSGLRSIAEQQEIMERFTEKYGAEYARKTVAPPGCSEHHTGLAVDLYYRLKNADGSVRDVYTNEELEEHPDIWAVIHGRLAEFGFILRYPEGKTHITGYQYEPWHIRYLDSASAAADIMGRPGLTLEEWLAEKGNK